MSPSGSRRSSPPSDPPLALLFLLASPRPRPVAQPRPVALARALAPRLSFVRGSEQPTTTRSPLTALLRLVETRSEPSGLSDCDTPTGSHGRIAIRQASWPESPRKGIVVTAEGPSGTAAGPGRVQSGRRVRAGCSRDGSGAAAAQPPVKLLTSLSSGGVEGTSWSSSSAHISSVTRTVSLNSASGSAKAA